MSGFYGALTNTGILSGEFNEQLGPTTPNTSPIDINKSNRKEADPLPENFGLATPKQQKMNLGMEQEIQSQLIKLNIS